MTKIFLALGLLISLAFAGCAPPQVLVLQRFTGDRVVRYTIQNSGASTEQTGALFDLRVRLCDQADDGSDQNCKDSLILENVVPRSVY